MVFDMRVFGDHKLILSASKILYDTSQSSLNPAKRNECGSNQSSTTLSPNNLLAYLFTFLCFFFFVYKQLHNNLFLSFLCFFTFWAVSKIGKTHAQETIRTEIESETNQQRKRIDDHWGQDLGYRISTLNLTYCPGNRLGLLSKLLASDWPI